MSKKSLADLSMRAYPGVLRATRGSGRPLTADHSRDTPSTERMSKSGISACSTIVLGYHGLYFSPAIQSRRPRLIVMIIPPLPISRKRAFAGSPQVGSHPRFVGRTSTTTLNLVKCRPRKPYEREVDSLICPVSEAPDTAVEEITMSPSYGCVLPPRRLGGRFAGAKGGFTTAMAPKTEGTARGLRAGLPHTQKRVHSEADTSCTMANTYAVSANVRIYARAVPFSINPHR